MDALMNFGQGLFGVAWPAVWTLLKIVAIVAPLMLGLAYLTELAGLSMAQRGTLFGLGFNAQWRNGSLLRLDVSQRGSELGDNRMVNASYRFRF